MDIQSILFELNLPKQKWLVVSVYKTPFKIQLTFLTDYLKLTISYNLCLIPLL